MAGLNALIDRTRLYALISALEADLREVLRQWVLPYKRERDVFGGRYELLRQRADKAGAADDASVLDYADFADSFEMINRHTEMVPAEICRAVKSYTPQLGQFIEPRNTVMHARPLEPGDLETGLRLCLDLLDQPIPLPTLRGLVDRVQRDPAWSPALDVRATSEAAIENNLPLPDFDETGLLGRDADHRKLLDWLLERRERMVTLVGEGGMGKTALAVKALWSLVHHAECPYDAVLWTSLKTERLTGEGVEAVRDAARDVVGVVHQLAQPLDTTFRGSIEDLAEVLHGLDVLIAIDNVESASGNEIVRFYDAMPRGCSYLLTSRVGLGQIERRVPIGPLDRSSGAKMLRVLADRRGLRQLSELAPQQLEAQVERLRGTPLAIRWYVEAIAAGAPPSVAIRDQSQLLRFCLETIYSDLSEAARRCVAVLYAAGGSLDAPQLAVASDVGADELSRALQDLQRRSLVAVQQGGPEGLHERYRLTAATTQYLASVDRPAGTVLKDAEARLDELRVSEERRQQYEAAAPTSATFFEVSTEEHKTVAHLLRKALLAARKSPELAREEVDRARGLAPDYYEVYRVDGFISTQAGHALSAKEAYERAYELADTERGRARVEYFYSWLLGSELGETDRAIEMAARADEVLDIPATSVRVAQFLLYAKRYPEAESRLRTALASDDRRTVLIARTQLLSLAKRRVEDLRRNRHVGDAVRSGAVALREISAYLDTGVADQTLRSKALDLALETMQAGGELPREADCDHELQSVLRYGVRHVDEIVLRPDRLYWERAVERLGGSQNGPDLSAALQEFGDAIQGKQEIRGLLGRIRSFDAERGYGFIDHGNADGALFFHRDDLRDVGVDVLLISGTTVRFRASREEKGLRARDVRVEIAPEVQADLLRNRRVRVDRKFDNYLFALDKRTKATVFVGDRAMRPAEWRLVSPGNELVVDVELAAKGARAIDRTARLAM